MIGEGPIVSLISGEEEGDGGDYVGDRVLASLPPRAPSPEEIEGSALKIGDIKAAQEMASAVRKQVLSEMNVAILAQANQTPGNARSLLQ
ncbi:MAG: hypothetical protein KDD70_07595 [Bdellovibrionales bacterium]|nr:hypothetical protein [Bdellovibrionales bacterium]